MSLLWRQFDQEKRRQDEADGLRTHILRSDKGKTWVLLLGEESSYGMDWIVRIEDLSSAAQPRELETYCSGWTGSITVIAFGSWVSSSSLWIKAIIINLGSCYCWKTVEPFKTWGEIRETYVTGCTFVRDVRSQSLSPVTSYSMYMVVSSWHTGPSNRSGSMHQRMLI